MVPLRGMVPLNYKEIVLSTLLIDFQCIISLLITFHFIALFIAFSKQLLKNQFLKVQCVEETVSLPNVFSIIQNWPQKKLLSILLFSNHGLNITTFSNRLNTFSVSKDVYTRLCILLIRQQRQIYRS